MDSRLLLSIVLGICYVTLIQSQANPCQSCHNSLNTCKSHPYKNRQNQNLAIKWYSCAYQPLIVWQSRVAVRLPDTRGLLRQGGRDRSQTRIGCMIRKMFSTECGNCGRQHPTAYRELYNHSVRCWIESGGKDPRSSRRRG